MLLKILKRLYVTELRKTPFEITFLRLVDQYETACLASLKFKLTLLYIEFNTHTHTQSAQWRIYNRVGLATAILRRVLTRGPSQCEAYSIYKLHFQLSGFQRMTFVYLQST